MDDSTRDERVEIYRRFFTSCHAWMQPEGALALQAICLENMPHVGDGPLPSFIRREVYPESLPPYLTELALAWDPHFRLVACQTDSRMHALTLRSWYLRLRRRRSEVEATFGSDVLRRFQLYLASCEALFRAGEWTVARLVLQPRREVKRRS